MAAAPKNENEFDFINQVDRPRYIKSHLPICFLPKQLWTAKPKIIYTMRDPKDTAISFYHHYYNLYKYQGSKEDYFDCFLDGMSIKINFYNSNNCFIFIFLQLNTVTIGNMLSNFVYYNHIILIYILYNMRK